MVGMRAGRRVMRGLFVAIGVAGASLLGGCGSSAAGGPSAPAATAGSDVLGGLVRTPTPVVRLAAVPDIAGRSFSFTAGSGAVQLFYFGYLSCPDVCPTTMADLKVALAGLGPAADRVQVAMMSVDPGRDTAENLRSYLDHFLPDARGLLPEDEVTLRTVADAFGASYSVETVDGVIEVAHSGFVYAVDERGRLLVQWPFGTPAADMTRDLTTLLARIDTGAAAEEAR
jgi:protein SCO1